MGRTARSGPSSRCPLPLISAFDAGRQKLTVASGKPLTLPSGASYARIEVRPNATLRLQGGPYHVGTLLLGARSRLEASAPTELFIADALSTGERAFLGITAAFRPCDLRISVYAGGHGCSLDAAVLGEKSELAGTLLAPNGRFHDGSDAFDFGGQISEVPVRGFRVGETALVHGPGRTAVVTDLVHNIGRPQHGWTKFYTRAMGFYDRVALSRALRWTAFDDKGAARQSVDALLGHAFEGLIVGHGAPISGVGRDALAAATASLPAVSRRLSVRSRPSALFSPKPCG